MDGTTIEFKVDTPFQMEGPLNFTVTFKENDEVMIIYTIAKGFDETNHGGMISDATDQKDTPVAKFSEEVKPITGAPNGAKVIQDHMGEGFDFQYYFLSWTKGYMEEGEVVDTGVVVADDSYATQVFKPQKVDGAYQEAVYIAHFATPIAQ